MREDEFLKLYEAHADAIFRHCWFRVYDRDRAHDLTQETFLRAWDYTLKGNTIEHAHAFLYRVANNLIIDEARKKKPVSLEDLEEGGFEASEDPRSALTTTLEAKELLSVLHKLEPEKRELIIMRYVDDLGPQEIASILGEAENVISVRLHRALKELRTLATPHE